MCSCICLTCKITTNIACLEALTAVLIEVQVFWAVNEASTMVFETSGSIFQTPDDLNLQPHTSILPNLESETVTIQTMFPAVILPYFLTKITV
jgi:hypothetical protein